MFETNHTAIQTPVTLSDKAITEIKKIMAENNLDESYHLRLGVKGGGCSGFSYSLTFDNRPGVNDTTSEVQGVKLVINNNSLEYLNGVNLDFSDGLQGRGFVFSNPNAKKTCGCGSSFGC